MGLFSFNKKEATVEPVASVPQTPTTCTEVDYAPSNGMLNLKKDNVLDLRKYSDSLSKVRVAAGWDFVGGKAYDLDICAFLKNSAGKVVDTVYYGDKNSKGIFLDGDNLTGEGEGDDENIHVALSTIPTNVSSIVFGVVIYNASSRRQKFSGVKNAYVRLVDEASGDKEICRYQLTEDGGDNTAVTFAELYRNDSGWSFRAIGKYSRNTIESLRSSI